MLKILLIILTISLANCRNFPPLPEELILYTGFSESQEICRDIDDCIPAESEEFNDYICLHRSQVEMLFVWIEEAEYSCR